MFSLVVRNHAGSVTIFPSKYFYPLPWIGLKSININKYKNKIDKESYMFQFGYTTNNFQKQFYSVQNK